MEPSVWNLPFGTFRLEPSVWNLPFGTFRLEPSVWNLPFGTFRLEPSVWNLPFGTFRLEPSLWNLPFGTSQLPGASQPHTHKCTCGHSILLKSVNKHKNATNVKMSNSTMVLMKMHPELLRDGKSNMSRRSRTSQLPHSKQYKQKL